MFKGIVSELLCDVVWCVCVVCFVQCPVVSNVSVRFVCDLLCGAGCCVCLLRVFFLGGRVLFAVWCLLGVVVTCLCVCEFSFWYIV